MSGLDIVGLEIALVKERVEVVHDGSGWKEAYNGKKLILSTNEVPNI